MGKFEIFYKLPEQQGNVWQCIFKFNIAMNKFERLFANIFPSNSAIGEIGSIQLNIWLANIMGVPLCNLVNNSQVFKYLNICYGICMLAVVTFLYTIFEINDLLQNLNNLDKFTENICLSFTHTAGGLKVSWTYFNWVDVMKLYFSIHFFCLDFKYIL